MNTTDGTQRCSPIYVLLLLSLGSCAGYTLLGSAQQISTVGNNGDANDVSGNTIGGSQNSNSGLTVCVPQSITQGPELLTVVTNGNQNLLLARQPNSTFLQGSCDAATVAVLNVDSNTTYQVMQGIGAALTDSAARVLSTVGHFSNGYNNAPQVIQQLFDPNKGLGLTFLHLSMAASEFSSGANYNYDGSSYQDPDPNLVNFSMGHDNFYLFNMVNGALGQNPNIKIMDVPWSPPPFMKASNSMASGFLDPIYYGTMAQFIVDVINTSASHGIPIWAVAAQNEPELSSGSIHMGYPSSLLSASEEATFIRDYLGPALQSSGNGNVKIVTNEGSWSNTSHPMGVLSDPNAAAYIAGTAFHCNNNDPNALPSDASAQDVVRQAFPNKEIYLSQCGRTVATGFQEDLDWYGENVITGAVQHGASIVALYNLFLYFNSTPNNGGCRNCRPLIFMDPNAPDFKTGYNVEYYILGHLSKFVVPDSLHVASTLLPSQNGTLTEGVYHVAFRRPDGKVVLFVSNTLNTATPLALHWGPYSLTYVFLPHSATTFMWSPSP